MSGLYPGNTANIVQSLTVCGSTVHVIDKVLVPATSLDAIPAPQVRHGCSAGSTCGQRSLSGEAPFIEPAGT